YSTRLAAQLGVSEKDAARTLLAARPADLVNALERLIAEGQRDMLGAFAIGPTYGTDYLPMDPVEAMRSGKAHRVPLIVGTN
ncbi:MAG: carboxylesterase family protein, partial [Mycobacterium sp.]|nr:carboxylesterase family protein [Mycobacterium sp.]